MVFHKTKKERYFSSELKKNSLNLYHLLIEPGKLNLS